MKPDRIRSAYQNFFVKSEEGQFFMQSLVEMIDGFHEKAEETAEQARDFTQQARGARQVLKHIQSNVTEVKKTSHVE